MRTIHHILLLCFLCVSLSVSGQERDFRFTKATSSALMPEVEAIPLNLSAIISQVEYPAKAIQAGIEGIVQVMVRVDRSGNYMEHEIVHSPHEMLSLAVAPYIGCLRFEPAQAGSMSVESWKAIPFRFKISQGVRFKRSIDPASTVCPKDSIFDAQPIVKTP
ncbi:MAG: energy transducer TonB [Bacteroidota bacterium]